MWPHAQGQLVGTEGGTSGQCLTCDLTQLSGLRGSFLRERLFQV